MLQPKGNDTAPAAAAVTARPLPTITLVASHNCVREDTGDKRVSSLFAQEHYQRRLECRLILSGSRGEAHDLTGGRGAQVCRELLFRPDSQPFLPVRIPRIPLSPVSNV